VYFEDCAINVNGYVWAEVERKGKNVIERDSWEQFCIQSEQLLLSVVLRTCEPECYCHSGILAGRVGSIVVFRRAIQTFPRPMTLMIVRVCVIYGDIADSMHGACKEEQAGPLHISPAAVLDRVKRMIDPICQIIIPRR